MRALVTGADGFIGSHLTELLVHSGYDVRALCIYNSQSNFGWLENSLVLSDVDCVLGDIRDPEFSRVLMKDIDVVFNLAALIAIPYSFIAPRSYFDTNLSGCVNLLHAALEANVERFVQMSTSEVYGTAQYVPMDELHPVNAQSPYAASKIASDFAALSYQKSFDLPVIVARPFNTFGPRQSARAVIPSIIVQCLTGNENLHLGNLNPTRDFNFVLDTCENLERLSRVEKAVGEIVNIGSGTEHSIQNLLEIIGRLLDADLIPFRDENRIRPNNSEVERLVCANQKFQSLVGDPKSTPLEEGLLQTIDWFRLDKHIQRYKSDIYNV